jgi:SlyX protein
MTEERIIEMEIKLAHQEDLLQELNSIVARQQKQISQLEETCKLLYRQQKNLMTTLELNPNDNQPPPHY